MIGFGDEKPSSRVSTILSKMRALVVRGGLLKLGVYTQPVPGFGANNPVAANSGDAK